MFGTDDNGQTWSEKQKLMASDGAAADYFGISLAIHNDTIVVGAPVDDNFRETDAGTFL